MVHANVNSKFSLPRELYQYSFAIYIQVCWILLPRLGPFYPCPDQVKTTMAHGPFFCCLHAFSCLIEASFVLLCFLDVVFCALVTLRSIDFTLWAYKERNCGSLGHEARIGASRVFPLSRRLKPFVTYMMMNERRRRRRSSA